MKPSEEFKTFYQTELLPILTVLEDDRKKLMRSMKPYLILFIVSLVITIGTLTASTQLNNPDSSNDNSAAKLLMLVGMGAIVTTLLIAGIYWLVYHFRFSKRIGDLRNRFKHEVISKMVKFIDASLVYDHHRGMPQADYNQSRIFVKRVDRYSCEDMVSGMLGSTGIRFSEVHAEEKIQRSNGKQTTTEWKTIFKGILFAADFNKNFLGRTVMVTDVAENILGSFGTIFQKMNSARDKLIKLEDVEFEKAFAVYGTDPVEAHYILSPTLMKRIVEFRKKSGPINLSFINSHVFIAIPVEATVNLFEPRIYGTLINYKRIEGYNKYLMLAISIVEDLNLNTRIWTKE